MDGLEEVIDQVCAALVAGDWPQVRELALWLEDAAQGTELGELAGELSRIAQVARERPEVGRWLLHILAELGEEVM